MGAKTWPDKPVNLVPESHFPFVQISSIYPTTAAKARNWYQRWLWWKGTRILVWKTFHLEKQDFLFICSVALRNFPLERTKKVAFHLLSNRNFWKLLVVFDLRLLIVNEFLSITSLEIGASLASMRSEIKPAAKGKLKLKKKDRKIFLFSCALFKFLEGLTIALDASDTASKYYLKNPTSNQKNQEQRH